MHGHSNLSALLTPPHPLGSPAPCGPCAHNPRTADLGLQCSAFPHKVTWTHSTGLSIFVLHFFLGQHHMLGTSRRVIQWSERGLAFGAMTPSQGETPRSKTQRRKGQIVRIKQRKHRIQGRPQKEVMPKLTPTWLLHSFFQLKFTGHLPWKG